MPFLMYIQIMSATELPGRLSDSEGELQALIESHRRETDRLQASFDKVPESNYLAQEKIRKAMQPHWDAMAAAQKKLSALPSITVLSSASLPQPQQPSA